MIVMVMLIGVYEVSEGAMTIGGLSTCSLLVGRIIGPIGQLVSIVHRVHQSQGTLRALAEGNNGQQEEALDKSGAVSVPRTGHLRLSGVSFNYPSQTARQVDNVSLTIRPGERVAIIGRSGSGKSTMLKLMTRLLDPTAGSVLVDELDARQYEPTNLRRTLGYLGQSSALFDDTLMANLTLGVDVVEPSKVEEISRLSGVIDFVARHPHGFAMRVGPRGEQLSGGERQSVALARLLLHNPKVMVLDEPTAAMDTMQEVRLVRDLKTYIGDRTFVIATHRVAMLELVDRLIWLDSGRVMADGPKAEVLARLSKAA